MILVHIKKIRFALLIIIIVVMSVFIGFTYNTVFGTAWSDATELPTDKMDKSVREFSSHLPIFVIQTANTSLFWNRDEPPGIVLWFFDGEAENRITDTPKEIFNVATAYYRGASSLAFPKLPYKINLYHSHFIEPLDYSFFGLAASSEWVLRSPYADKSLLRDWFSYELAATVLDWQPRGRPVQLFVQNSKEGKISYRGVYFFSENITVGEGRLEPGQFDLNTSNTIDFDGGGYVVQRDRPRFNYFTLPGGHNIRYSHPSLSQITTLQDAQLRKEIGFYFDYLSIEGKYADLAGTEWDYQRYIDVDSFIDYFLIVELIRSIDSGEYSTFMHRPFGEKLVMGPLWDCDYSMGNTNYAQPYYHSFINMMKQFSIRNLMDDEDFKTRYIDRWTELRGSIWSDHQIFGMFDEMVEYLIEPAAQNALRWPEKYDGKTHIFSNPEPYTTSWDEEIERTREWLVKRVKWLDEHIPRLRCETPEKINDSYESEYE
ncbi:MAG: CotH kinase family protein [Oscillospiraceae bacterium]|jgi:hypothetical protein|nr:CotH kinase family protein [Oscillospiraceae bacterium]